MPKAVVALGGNALIKPGQEGTLQEQLKNVDNAVSHVVELVKSGYRITVTHGNGPQVGNILLQNELSKEKVPVMPLYVCVAESQALIGYMLQEAFYNKLNKAGLDIPVITMLTQVLVDRKDPAFKEPSKPIGPFYRSKRGLPKDWKLTKTKKGWRRLVPSPDPKTIVEENSIRRISESRKPPILIACGGGGIPVVRKNGLQGVDAVIDKDLAAQRLAKIVKAEMLIILTDVPQVFLNYGKKNEEKLKKMNLNEAREYLKQGQFPPGSMGPKIKAAMKFLEGGGKKVIITDFKNVNAAIKGRRGTTII